MTSFQLYWPVFGLNLLKYIKWEPELRSEKATHLSTRWVTNIFDYNIYSNLHFNSRPSATTSAPTPTSSCPTRASSSIPTGPGRAGTSLPPHTTPEHLFIVQWSLVLSVQIISGIDVKRRSFVIVNFLFRKWNVTYIHIVSRRRCRQQYHVSLTKYLCVNKTSYTQYFSQFWVISIFWYSLY